MANFFDDANQPPPRAGDQPPGPAGKKKKNFFDEDSPDLAAPTPAALQSSGLGNFLRATANTFGEGDMIMSLLHGTSLADEHAITEKARSNLGLLGNLGADYLGSGGPLLGWVGAGRSLAGAVAPSLIRTLGETAGGIAAGGLGGAAETGALSTLASLGRGDSDPLSEGLMGAATGGVLGGALGRVGSTAPGMRPPASGIGPPAPASPAVPGPLTSTPQLFADSQLKNQALEGIHFDPQHVDAAFNGATMGLSKKLNAGMSDSLSGKINTISQQIAAGGPVTADDIAGFQRALSSANRGGMDSAVVGKLNNALDDVLTRAPPLPTSTTPIGPQGIKGMVDEANMAASKAKTSQELDALIQDPASAPGKLGTALANSPEFYNQAWRAPELFPVLQKIAGMKAAGEGPSWYLSHHILGPMMFGGIPGAVLGDPTGHAEGFMGHLAGFLGGTGMMAGVRWNQARKIADALRKAQYLSTMGGPKPPSAMGSALSGAGNIGSNLLQATGQGMAIGGDWGQ